MAKYKIISLVLIFISLSLLAPGLAQPILKLTLTTEIKAKIGEFKSVGLDKNRSILSTVKDLYDDDRKFVAFLILLFSVLVPFIKIVLLLWALLVAKMPQKEKFFEFVNSIGKWSMADVFVVAIFIAYLSTTGQGSARTFEVSYLGLVLPVSVNTMFESSLGPGFFFFLAYCLISIASLHCVKAHLYKELNLQTSPDLIKIN
ncbi:MAG: paraquat-inducible protein A [Bdellovibrio sp.]|nr:paraquat-inducible protein A [Bdellovibrio sp.]